MSTNAQGRGDQDLFGSAGALRDDYLAVDWSESLLGPVAHWPEPLCTALSICLASRFPILIWWGPDLVMLYNDAYRAILGDKHPTSLAAPGVKVWPEIWDVIGPMLTGVLQRGAATYSEDQLLLLERRGFSEECYFTFSYSPIRGGGGGVDGVFTAVTETTGRVLSTRRLDVLRQLGEQLARASETGADAVIDDAMAVLRGDGADLPAVDVYRQDRDGRWVARAEVGLIDPVAHAGALSKSVGTDGPRLVAVGATMVALVPTPVTPGGAPPAVLACRLSQRLAADDDYLSFLTLAGHAVGTGLSAAHALEAERQRAERLAELDRAKTVFFSNISHELRTPLTLLIGPLDELRRRGQSMDGQERGHLLELASRNTRRLRDLVDNLLEFARAEAGRLVPQLDTVDLVELVDEVVSSFREPFAACGIELCTEGPGESVGSVIVDRSMIERVLLNLLSNSLKHTFTGTVTVRLGDGPESVHLAVSDTGTGIPAEALPTVFERFIRVEGLPARSHEGTGLGLAMVRELVGLHGGEVEIASAMGTGTTVSVRLPRRPGHQDRLGADDRNRSSPPPGGPPGVHRVVEEALSWLPAQSQITTADTVDRERLRIVVAEDNADMRGYVARLLAPVADVTTVADGAAALRLIRTEIPDLLISDVMMPGLDGFGLLRELKASAATAEVPVLLLSARAGEEAALEGLEAGADDYLTKPFTSRELLARVRGHLVLASARHRERAAVADAQARAERERRVAEVLQRSLLPQLPHLEELEVAARYAPGVHDVEVGGDWYDVIDLGAGRVAVVVGDVMGRGVAAAAVMGQLRAAVRGYAQLDLPPWEVLTLLDRLVDQLGETNFVTCLYGVYDPADGRLTMANAGHFPPMATSADGVGAQLLAIPAAAPLGSGQPGYRDHSLDLKPGTVLALFTDGLVESRGHDLEDGLQRLADVLGGNAGSPLAELADVVLAHMDAHHPHDDDTALLLVRPTSSLEAGTRGPPLVFGVPPRPGAVALARNTVATTATEWGVGTAAVEAARLVVSELVTNAIRYGEPPLEVRVRASRATIYVEVTDAGRYRPHRRDAMPTDESGRGLPLVSAVARRWGVRPGLAGKVVWAEISL